MDTNIGQQSSTTTPLSTQNQSRTIIVINGKHHQDGNVGHQTKNSQLSSVAHTPVTPGTYDTTTSRQDQGRRTYICLPSPTSSPVATTGHGRVIQTYLITTPLSTSTYQPQNIASSPLPPPFPWTYSEDDIHDTANVQLSPVSPVRLSHSPLHLASSPFNGPLCSESENDHCNLIASGSEMTVADFAIATSESDSVYSKSERSESSRRGRPRLDDITTMIMDANGGASTSIRCRYCARTFPREKSLQAHIRTHTGERPYVCDFDSCGRAFAQSGQLRTHQRLHTGEKPFICAHDGKQLLELC